MIHKQGGENQLVMVGIEAVRLMFVLHQKVLCGSYAFTTANVHDSKIALLQDIEDQHVLFSLPDAAYDSQHIYNIAGTCDIFSVNPINSRNGEQMKSSHRRV